MTQHAVCFYCVVAFVLKVIGPQLIEETDASPFLTEVQKNPCSLGGNPAHRCIELLSTITAQGPEDIARKTLRMDTNQYVIRTLDISVDESKMILVVVAVLVQRKRKLPVDGRNPGARQPTDF
jgi:hypothetical protein